jgi:hypothetical protein
MVKCKMDSPNTKEYMTQCKNCGCYPKGNECHLCNTKSVEVKEKPKYRKIRYRTLDRAKDERKYSVRAKVFLMLNPRCGVFPDLRSNQVHHKKGRSGKMLLEEKYFMAVSQEGHDWIRDNPTLAEEKGYTIKRSTNEKA